MNSDLLCDRCQGAGGLINADYEDVTCPRCQGRGLAIPDASQKSHQTRTERALAAAIRALGAWDDRKKEAV